MESSAISLYFSLLRRPSPEAAAVQSEHLINLIDSPGHIDFSSEVSTASRLCDGAVVLVDAVEGVCSQTVTVLRQCWIEKIRPLLVINKMDRLVTELRMSPAEAYTHLSQLLEQVNVVMGEFYQGERMEDDLRWRERMEEKARKRRGSAAAAAAAAASNGDATVLDESSEGSVVADPTTTAATVADYEEKDDEDIYFAPEKNNVIFSSAVDGWAFTVKQFAGLYEKKLGIRRAVLEKVLWGDFYLEPKTKRVLGSKHLRGRSLKPMFVQLVLDNVWAVYEATTGGGSGKGYVRIPCLPLFCNAVCTRNAIHSCVLSFGAFPAIPPWSRRSPGLSTSPSRPTSCAPATHARSWSQSSPRGCRCRPPSSCRSSSTSPRRRPRKPRACRASLRPRRAATPSTRSSRLLHPTSGRPTRTPS